MKLTKEQAIDLSIKQWQWIVKTGGLKRKFISLITSEDISHDCFLCEYTCQDEDDKLCRCNSCPYYEKYGNCCNADTPFLKYNRTNPPEDKKYARQFIKQLKELKK